MENNTQIAGFCRIYRERFGNEDGLQKSYTLLERACALANKKYETYARHNTAVALILLQTGMDKKNVLAGLNHNLVTLGLTEKEVESEFGKEILAIITEKERLEKALSFKNENTQTLKKKLMIVMSANPEIFILQLAETIDKARNPQSMPQEERRQFLIEAKDAYAPLALKLGIYGIGSELNDIVFREQNPQKYFEIEKKIKSVSEKLGNIIEETREKIIRELADAKIKPEVYGRIKTIYSTNEKMKRKNVPIEKIYDLVAVRIITENEKECYETLGIIHSLWKPVPGEFDDYIAKPKENGYRSLHTSVYLERNIPVEIQIRTKEMHNFAEYGMASHWSYKGEKKDGRYDKKIEWVKQVLDWQSEAGSGTHIDIFGRQVFAMTPKGEIIELPEGSTVIDFAYAVHSDLGHKCHGAKINGKLSQLQTQIRNGDVIEIITAENQIPKISWLNFTKTGKAKQKIRSYLGLDKKEEKKHTLLAAANSFKTSDSRARLAKCCSPLPGDEILGIKTTKRKISIHRTNCSEISKIRGRVIPVSWSAGTSYYETSVIAITKDTTGILKEILGVFLKNKISVISASAQNGNQDMNFCTFKLKVKNLGQLENICEKIGQIKGVNEVRR